MPYITSWILAISSSLLCLGYSTCSIANVQATDELSDDQVENLHAIHHLDSLKNLNPTLKYAPPKIESIENPYHVPTLFVASPYLAMVDIQINFNAGSARDHEISNSLTGLASSTARLMTEGTPQYNAQEITAAFENLGAQMSFSASRDVFSVKLRSLSDPKKLDAALDLVLHLLNQANFNHTSIQRMVDNNAVGQKQLQANPSRMLGIQFNRALYGKHPYAEPITGTTISMKKISANDMNAFRTRFLVRQNANIAITGQLSHKQAKKLTYKIAQQLHTGEKAQPLPAAKIQDQLKIQHLKFNAAQAHVLMGHITTSRHDPDRLALQVANRMLGGGGFNTVLMQELRVKRGLTYSANSSFSFSQSNGTFSLSYSTRPDQLIESIIIAHQALVNFVQQPMNVQQLESTKAGMLRAFPRTLGSNADINAQLAALGFHQESAAYLDTYSEKLAQISAQDVQNAVRKHIHPDRLTIIVASNELDQVALKQKLWRNIHAQ